MSIVIPTGRTRTGVALPDARTSRTGARLKRTRPLAVLAVLSYAAVAAASIATAWWARSSLGASPSQAERMWQLGLVAIATAAVITAAWTYRVARNAAARGVPNVRPRAAALAWFVPLAGPPAAIRTIGRLLRELDYSERRLAFWLFGLYAHIAASAAGSIVVLIAVHTPEGAPAIDAVRDQTNVLWLQAALNVLVTLLAARAVLHADRAVSSVGKLRSDQAR